MSGVYLYSPYTPSWLGQGDFFFTFRGENKVSIHKLLSTKNYIEYWSTKIPLFIPVFNIRPDGTLVYQETCVLQVSFLLILMLLNDSP
jgi:hypothetical protein